MSKKYEKNKPVAYGIFRQTTSSLQSMTTKVNYLFSKTKYSKMKYSKMLLQKVWLIAAVCCTLTLNAQNSDRTMKSALQKVTVFQQGAQLFHSELVSVSSGVTNVIFENVSPSLVQSSIQAAAKSDLVVVMDVQYQLKYTEVKTKLDNNDPNLRRWKSELQAAQDSLDELAFTRKDIQNRNSALTGERTILLNNKMLRGELQRDSLALFTQSIDFLRQRLNNVNAELLKIERETQKENRLNLQLQTRLNYLQTLIAGTRDPNETVSPQPVPQVIVTVQADAATAVTISLNYFVASAGWTTSYDLRAGRESPNIELRHKGAVYQNTGVDWKDVPLTLSTGNPNQNNEKPVLYPFLLDFDQAIVYNQRAQAEKRAAQQYNLNRAAMPATAEKAYDTDNAKLKEIVVRDMEEFVQASDNLTRTEYEIKLRYTILSDGKPHNVAIQNKSLPATYNYSVIPKLDPDVFLMASVTDWESLNLVAGTARIYFDGSFVGQSQINPRNFSDTLQLNLGRDKSIIVTRQKVKDKSRERILSDKKVVTKVFEITVRNTKNVPIRLIIDDQMPVSKVEDIKVEYTELSGGKMNTETGKTTWDVNVRAKDNRKITFSYEVKFDKDKQLTNL
jgi:uncharacterized protein (TIGR02231 family)